MKRETYTQGGVYVENFSNKFQINIIYQNLARPKISNRRFFVPVFLESENQNLYFNEKLRNREYSVNLCVSFVAKLIMSVWLFSEADQPTKERNNRWLCVNYLADWR